MISCPECDAAIDIDEEDVDEGDILSCDECGADLRVIGVNPLEIESHDDDDEEDEEDDNFLDEDEEDETGLDDEDGAEDEWH